MKCSYLKVFFFGHLFMDSDQHLIYSKGIEMESVVYHLSCLSFLRIMSKFFLIFLTDFQLLSIKQQGFAILKAWQQFTSSCNYAFEEKKHHINPGFGLLIRLECGLTFAIHFFPQWFFSFVSQIHKRAVDSKILGVNKMFHISWLKYLAIQTNKIHI